MFGSNFSLYPNPTDDGVFSIKIPGLYNDVELQVFDVLGKTIINKTLEADGNAIKVNEKTLNQGVYIVKLSQGEKSFIAKLIVK